jgi:putative aldouronate transport system substrate-binding protein
MKRKALHKVLCIVLTVVLVLSMAGCKKTDKDTSNPGGAKTTPATTDEGKKEDTPTEAVVNENEIKKPETITIMVDKTLLDEASGQQQFKDKFFELTGIKLEIIQPDHNTYYDQVALAFTSGMEADAIILGSSYYAAYAANGALWDMTEAWENSESKSSGRVNADYIDALKIDGKLYGFSPARGNGCITYLRQDWLDKLNLSVPTNYNEYMEVLRAFTEDDPDGNGTKDTYGVTASGIIGPEVPFTNYLPEFWQDAYPDFYEKADGTWVDGFTDEAMTGALTRLKDAYSKGYIDMEVVSNTTSACRDKFYAGNVGAFTYWAGKWNMTMEQNIQTNFPNASLVAIDPITEVGKYIERQPPVWAITNACENPEGVFKYLIEAMVDGSDGQLLWTYGAEGTHWEKAADGTFTQLPDPEVPTSTFLSAHVDPMLSISAWEDPLANTRDTRISVSSDKFLNSSYVAKLVVSTEAMSNYQATLTDIRTVIVADVVTGSMSVEDGIAAYKTQATDMVNEILAQLNSK